MVIFFYYFHMEEFLVLVLIRIDKFFEELQGTELLFEDFELF